MKPAILAAMPLSARLREQLAERYTLHGGEPGSPKGVVPEAARGARALITLGSLRTDAALIAALPELGMICCYGTGFEGVDRAAAGARGIICTHAGDANATGVAEFAIGLMLAASRHMLRGDRLIRSGQWNSVGLERMPLVPGLAGRRIGIYGLGSIGLKIAQRCAAFEMAVGYHNRRPRADLPYAYQPSLPALAEWADILMVAVRAGPENRRAVNAAVLRALGPAGLLVNISRGIAVDEAALCDALEAGTIAGAGLDVFEDEPNVPQRLLALENVVLTPHMAALTSTSQHAQQDLLLDNLDAFFAGGTVRWTLPG